jgi:putative sterol carrier protein
MADDTVEFLSDEWCGLFVAEAVTLPRRPGATVSQEMTLHRPDGTSRSFTLYFVDGVVDRVELGPDSSADLHASYPEDVWVPWCEGDMNPLERAVLTGKARLVGGSAAATRAAPIEADDLRAVLERVHARTRYPT